MLVFSGLWLLTCLASLLICAMLIKVAPKDAPDGERKTQHIAVPTSGGIAIALAVSIAWIIFLGSWGDTFQRAEGAVSFSAWRVFSQNGGALFLLMWILALGLGALDDWFTLQAKLKFAALALLALFACAFGQYVDGIFLPVADSYIVLASWLGIGGSALWLFVVMNATNFMDGANGLALGTLAVMLAGMSLHTHFDLTHSSAQSSQAYNQELLSVLGALTVAAIVGFLFWNLQGKLYAGDAGALFGGAVFASLGIYAAKNGNIWFPATLALPFLVDVFMTLLWRAKREHNLLTPHRHHAYQLLIKSGWSHIKTALLWWSFALVCAMAALWAISQSIAISAFVFLGMLGLGCALWIIQRMRTPEAVKTG